MTQSAKTGCWELVQSVPSHFMSEIFQSIHHSGLQQRKQDRDYVLLPAHVEDDGAGDHLVRDDEEGRRRPDNLSLLITDHGLQRGGKFNALASLFRVLLLLLLLLLLL